MIHATRTGRPDWDPEPGQTRELIAGIWVEWSGVRPTDAEVQAKHRPTPTQVASVKRTVAATLLEDPEPIHIRVRAGEIRTYRYAKQLLEARNELTAWLMSLKTAIAAAPNTPAGIKAAVASLPNMPQIPVPTRQDHKSDILALINADVPNG